MGWIRRSASWRKWCSEAGGFQSSSRVGMKLPAGAAFLIGNCLAVSNKAVTAARAIQSQVMECRLTPRPHMALGSSREEALGYSTLIQVQKLVGSLEEAGHAAEHLLPERTCKRT